MLLNSLGTSPEISKEHCPHICIISCRGCTVNPHTHFYKMQRGRFLMVSTPHRPLPQSLSRRWQGKPCSSWAWFAHSVHASQAGGKDKPVSLYISPHKGFTKINAENGGVNWEPLVKLSPATNQLCNPGQNSSALYPRLPIFTPESRISSIPTSMDSPVLQYPLAKLSSSINVLMLPNMPKYQELSCGHVFTSIFWVRHCLRSWQIQIWLVKVKVTQLCPTLCYPIDLVHGILQARILEWVAFPFSRGSSQPRDQTHVSHIAGGFFTSWATREARFLHLGRKQ